MIPFELKIDKEGFFYADDNHNLMDRIILIDNRKEKNDYYKSEFYRFYSTDEYIIKKPITILNKRSRIEYKNMLVQLLELQEKVLDTDFPIGYFKYDRHFAGLVVRFYKNSVSFDKIVQTSDINMIGKYYPHDVDNVHNMFLLLNELLERLYEMYINGIQYMDIVENNIILTNGEIKIIDFDPTFVRIDDDCDRKRLRLMLNNYLDLIKRILKEFQLYNEKVIQLYQTSYGSLNDFDKAKSLTKSIEDRIRNK